MNRNQYLQISVSLLVFAALLLSGLAILPGSAIADLANTAWPMFHHDLRHTGRSPYLGPQTNALKWFYLNTSIFSSPAIGRDGTIYFGSIDHSLYAINPDGSRKWSYATSGEIHSSPTVGSDGTIYIGSRDGKLYAITDNGTNGSLKWFYATGNWIQVSPTIGIDGTIYLGSDKLYAITDNVTNGSLKWSYATNLIGFSSPAIGADATIYLSSEDGYLYAITDNITSGILKWRFDTGSGIYMGSPAIGSDGTIYVGTKLAHKLYAITDNLTNGSLKWFYNTGDWVQATPAIATDGTIYVGSENHNLYAITDNGTNCNVKWSYATSGGIRSSAAIGIDGTIYLGSMDNKIYAIKDNGATCSLKWSYNTAGGIEGSPAIGSDGTLYLGSYDGKLYAIEAAPTVMSFQPTLGWAGTTVVITGTSFTHATEVAFGGTAATAFHVDSDTQITATAGAGTTGKVSVATPGGTGTSAGEFTLMGAPTIDSCNPNNGNQGQTLPVLISGTNFTGTTGVTFGPGITVSSFTVNSATQITANIAIAIDAAPGACYVLVTTHGGTATLIGGFTVIQQNQFTGTGSHSSTGAGTTATTQPVSLSNIQTQSARLSANVVTSGTPVTVTADIINRGTINGNKKVTLYVNGQVETTQGVTVNSGGSSKLTFNVTRSEPGDYTVSVDGVPAGSFKVEMVTRDNGILIFSIVLMAMAFILGMVVLWRRQHLT